MSGRAYEGDGAAGFGRSRIAVRADLAALFACDPHSASSDGAVTGFIVTQQLHFYGRDFVGLLVVSESHRHRGIGRSLLRAVVESAAPGNVWTSTNESNLAMRELLVSEGWQFSGILRGLDEGDPELVFYMRQMDV